MEIRLWSRSDELAHEVRSARQRHETLDRLFVELDDGVTVGYGEVTPLALATNGDPAVHDVSEALVGPVLARFVDVAEREGAPPAWSRVHLLSGDRQAERVAFAAVEMATLDWELRRAHTTIAASWGLTGEAPRCATVSALTPDFTWSPSPEVARVRLKVAGPPSAAVVEWVRSFRLGVLVDFNCGAGTVENVHATRDALVGVDLVAIEQPFAPGDLATPALLARELDVPLSLDESVRTVADVRRIARHHAAALVCVKPPRLGGLAPARAALREAANLGLRSYVGGFFESPLARTAHAAVAAGATVEASDVGAVPTAGAGGDETIAFGFTVRPALARAVALGSQRWA